MLNSAAACQLYIQTQEPAAIASQLRRDQDLCALGRLPSLLALYLPPPSSELAGPIAFHLQRDNSSQTPLSVKRIQYAGIIQGIKAHMEHMSHNSNGADSDRPNATITDIVTAVGEIETTLKVLGLLVDNQDVTRVTPETPLKDVLKALVSFSESNSSLHQIASATTSQTSGRKKIRKCYICLFQLTDPHPLYPNLCSPCGNFNLAESNLSLPSELCLAGKTALVTGGRVNLGFHTALRLLRCGAKVIVSSRYPRDAEKRYRAEKDSPVWWDRLRTVGADFRAARDVFHMVSAIKEKLISWDPQQEAGRLDILINNAAQTLTDSIEVERKAIEVEEQLQSQESNSILSSGYRARVRGTSSVPWLTDGHTTPLIRDGKDDEIVNPGHTSKNDSLWKPAQKSSWVQAIHEIPYEDVVSAYSINAFVPLILIRELLPFMVGGSNSASTARNPAMHPVKPAAYIVNVSSREGIFESSPLTLAKRGCHVHTNMSKAGLNMITQTEGALAWDHGRVAMNSVDPGYMSAAPEVAKAHSWNCCPIGWEDGAGRVLWPIAQGEIRGKAIWGRFLKHFVSVEVGK